MPLNVTYVFPLVTDKKTTIIVQTIITIHAHYHIWQYYYDAVL